jgi:hypothetical protein
LNYAIPFIISSEGFVVDPFWGATTPQSITLLQRAEQACGKEDFRISLNIALRYLQGETLNDEDYQRRNEVLVAGCQAIIQAALKVCANQEVVIRDLTNFGVSQESALEIWKVC